MDRSDYFRRLARHDAEHYKSLVPNRRGSSVPVQSTVTILEIEHTPAGKRGGFKGAEIVANATGFPDPISIRAYPGQNSRDMRAGDVYIMNIQKNGIFYYVCGLPRLLERPVAPDPAK